MAYQSSLFIGTTPKSCRDLIAEKILALKPKVIYCPCAGRFTVPEILIKRGIAAENLWCSDIALLPSVIGYMADLNHSYEELGVVLPEDAKLSLESDDMARIGDLLMHLNFSSLKPTSKFATNWRREYKKNWDKYHAQLRDEFQQTINNIAGIHYEMKDLYAVIDEAEKEEGAVLYVAPPDGKERTFEDANLYWESPALAPLEPDMLPALFDRLRDSPLASIIYFSRVMDKLEKQALNEPLPLELVPEGWHAFFAKAASFKTVDFAVSNREISGARVIQKNPGKRIKKFPIYDDAEITAQSKIEILSVNKETGWYYRDLFAHNFGVTAARSYFLMKIDGKIATAFAFRPNSVLMLKTEYLDETFGVTVNSDRYPVSLGKLFDAVFTSGEMYQLLCNMASVTHDGLAQLRGIHRYVICESKEPPIIEHFVVEEREQLKDGRFFYTYVGDFRDDSFAEVLERWLSKILTVHPVLEGEKPNVSSEADKGIEEVQEQPVVTQSGYADDHAEEPDSGDSGFSEE